MDASQVTQNWKPAHREKLITVSKALSKIKPGHRIFIGSGAATPQVLVQGLALHSDQFYDNELLHILTLGADPTAQEQLSSRFRHSAFFLGSNMRDAVHNSRADYTPIFLSEIPTLFSKGLVPVDVALIQVSLPDSHGFVSYGVSVDIVKPATEAAKLVIAQVNPKMPRTLGNSFIHLDQIDALVWSDEPLPELESGEPGKVSMKIGRYVASLIQDGSTLQMGIGSSPNAVLANLGDKKNLGIHTEMFSDGVLPLIEQGVINNSKKTLHRGKIITSFVMGTQKLYDFVNDNPLVEFHPSQYTNDPFLIAQHDKMVAINSAIQVDLTGQVCADSIGHKLYSGIGGQVDFIRGAARSRQGRPIIALPSTAKGETLSRIVLQLSDGAGVVTTRGDVHYVVTEYGVANLFGKSIRHRALALINIAHPKFRKGLIEGAMERGYLERESIVLADEKAEYPQQWEKAITLQGQPLLIRPLKSTDDHMVKDLFYHQSDETRYFRFFSVRKYLPRQVLKNLVQIDYQDTMALCVLETDGEKEKIWGVARYYVNRHTNLAEFAISIHDEWQGKGLGKALFSHLLRVAREQGIDGFTADIMEDNRRMFGLLKALNLPCRETFDHGTAHVVIPFNEITDKARI